MFILNSKITINLHFFSNWPTEGHLISDLAREIDISVFSFFPKILFAFLFFCILTTKSFNSDWYLYKKFILLKADNIQIKIKFNNILLSYLYIFSLYCYIYFKKESLNHCVFLVQLIWRACSDWEIDQPS